MRSGVKSKLQAFASLHLVDHLRLAHYHEERPHQSLANEPLCQPKQRGRPTKYNVTLDEQIVPL
jgi:hypothetical protein